MYIINLIYFNQKKKLMLIKMIKKIMKKKHPLDVHYLFLQAEDLVKCINEIPTLKP